MKDRDFRALVADMRVAQKEFFRTRSSLVLARSKKLERAVDDELREITSPAVHGQGETGRAPSVQGALFEERVDRVIREGHL